MARRSISNASCSATVMDRGATITSWHPQDAHEALFVSRAANPDAEFHGGIPICMAPFVFLFVGYDGKYYLCCADWKKEVSYGTVFDAGLADVMGPKLLATRSREKVCNSCNIDPINILTDTIRDHDRGLISAEELTAAAAGIAADTAELERIIEATAPGTSTDPAYVPATQRRLIPLV